uniref:Uncharacterized protein n=1 Tax=viral metagenome TaxID=1070528 RepID=A0A6C0CEM5_9ZZZZ
MTDIVNIEMYNNLVIENELLKKKNIELEEKLKAYTNTERNKRYYEKNSEKVKEKAKNYMERMKTENPEKLKEWRHNAYMNRKNKKDTIMI